MRGFKLYAIIVAISCLILQEASCTSKHKKPFPKTVSDEEVEDWRKSMKAQQPEFEEEEDTVGSYNCEEYKSKIWEKAFSSENVLLLANRTFETAKMMGTDEVCSDTTRALFNFIDVIGTNNFAFFSMRMIYKMITVIIRDTDTSSVIYKETQKVVSSILMEPSIRELTLLSLLRPIEMMKNKVTRQRALRTLMALYKLAKPRETKKNTESSNKIQPKKMSLKKIKK